MDIGEHLNRYRVLSPQESGGPNSPITEARIKTAELLGKSLQQICGLTRNWSKDQIQDLLREAQVDGKVPAKFWWYLYKQKKHIYGKTKKKDNPRGLRGLGKNSRREKQEERQGILFGDREEGGIKKMV